MVVVLWLLLLPLWHIVHRVRLARLIQQWLALLFTVLHLLVLLHKIARPAAASAETVLAAISSQVVLRANVSSIDERQDPSETHAGQSGEGSALRPSVPELRLNGMKTYTRVTARVVAHVAVGFHAVTGAPVEDARAPP